MHRHHHNMLHWLYGLDGLHFTADIQRDWVGKYRHFLEAEKGVSREKSGPIAEKFVSDFIDFLHNNGLKESPEGTWIFRNIVDGTLRWPEDADKVVELIRDFYKVRKSGNFRAERDLLKYKRFPELWEVVNDYFGRDNGPEPDMNLPGVNYLGAYKNLKLYMVRNADSMAKIANRGSGWCVKNVRYGMMYLKDGPFLLITKNGKNYVLIHEGSGQAKDVSDDTINHEIAGEIFPLVKSHISGEFSEKTGELAVFLNFYPEEYQIDKVSEYPEAIQYLSNPSDPVQMAAVSTEPHVILYIPSPSYDVQILAVEKDPNTLAYGSKIFEEIQIEAVRKDGSLINYISHPSEKVIREALKSYPYAIRYMRNAPEELQLLAVGHNPKSIQFITHPTERVQLAAVREDGDEIQLIDNPTERVQLEAVKNNPYAIRYIKNPSLEVQLAAVRIAPYCICHIKNPTEKVQLEAVGRDKYAIRYIKNPVEAAQLDAVSTDPELIRYIENPTERVQLEAVRRDRTVIRYIKNPSETVIRYIKNPSEAAQLEDMRRDRHAMQFIHNPTNRVLEESLGTNTAMDSNKIQSNTYATRKSMIRWIYGNHTNGRGILRGFPDIRGHLN